MGMDSNDVYAYGRSPKGERCHAKKPGIAKKRLSVISCLHNGKLAAPCIFECHTDADIFNLWIEAAGCRLPFMSPYSPDLNPIEHRWFPLKNAARKIMQTLLCLDSALEAAILMT